MKTVFEWYQELPDNIRERALSNLKEKRDLKVNSLSAAIQLGFIWNDTEEKEFYWHNVYTYYMQ